MTGASNPTSASAAPASPRLTVFAWVAARLAGLSVTKEFAGWTERSFGHPLGQDEISEHVVPLRPSTGRGRPRTQPHPSPAPARGAPAIIDWLQVDEQRLGLVSLLLEIPNPSFEARPELVDDLAALPGIRQVVELKEDGDVLALGVVRDLTEADDLKARVQEAAGGGVRMRLVGRESQAGAATTWFELARREAASLGGENH